MKQSSKPSWKCDFNSAEVKKSSEGSARYLFDISEVKDGSECTQIYHFYSIEIKRDGVFREIMVIILKQSRVFSTVRIFFNSSDEAKELIERSQRFNFNNSDERKQLNELCQICHFNGREVKQGSECSQRFHCSSSEAK